MFYSRSTNRRINYLHESAVRLIYDDYELTFEEFLEKDGSFTIHHCNIPTLCIELYQVYHSLSLTVFSVLFRRNVNCYNLCLKPDFVIPQVRTVFKGSNSIRHYGPIIWSLVSEEIRYTDSLEKFKNKIRRWKPSRCLCRICKITSLMLNFYKYLNSISLLRFLTFYLFVTLYSFAIGEKRLT